MQTGDNVQAGRLLLVDDNRENLQLLSKILRNDGYENIDCTDNPTEVRQLYREGQHDLVLLDIHMPVLNGFEVMAQLQEDYPNDYLPILMLTADHTKEAKLKALSNGAKDFINKPFERFEILLRVRNILEVRMLHKKLQMNNALLEQRVSERTKQLNDSQIKLIEILGKAAEFRDNETGMHVIRMSKSAALLAKELGLPDDECEIILNASPMHDIGKIAIPDNVLLKPGPLDNAEWRIMKSHAEVGAEILSAYDSDLFDAASEMAYGHHEKWDGTGYPQGLSGEEIPLHCRIISVCDVFDALLSKRPYKSPWDVQKALQYLRDKSGSDFDPKVVDGFESIITPVLQLRLEHPDVVH